MKRNLKRWSALGAAAVSLAGAMVVAGGATSAHADTRCTWGWIWINDSAGGDPKTQARGHSHDTGNHYVRDYGWDAVSGRYLWNWWADNDGGSDGDTADTYFGSRWCGSAPW
ncbi:hypothetical protein [Streptosporangium roseum]|uniref:Uncharacterized protein n=1 Tax=Streptosporangium roseum (strain ATCC 12428 / DSM 43021 / JCM 3005 / KCTC 9067 / NCIMB 10171 / NRRL 2505 / NI 9100) TaxID=479432 RepID=D2B1A3_STRRD|nr:hypothetical protein [Streptosporangium roseum]ACZ85368.1 hypothetical protein Sros_2389 [Streptosporangium roseum DSM 43021]